MPAKKLEKRGKKILWEKVPYQSYVKVKNGTLMFTVLKTEEEGGYICNGCICIGEFLPIEKGSLCYLYKLVPA